MINNFEWETIKMFITEGQVKYAEKISEGLKRTLPNTQKLHKHFWKTGTIGEVAGHLLMVNNGIEHRWDPPGSNPYGDHWDYIINLKTIDVKTQRYSRDADLEQYVIVKKGSELKPIDYYWFAIWLPEESSVRFLGWIEVDKFYAHLEIKEFKKGDRFPNGEEAKCDCWGLKIKYLNNTKELFTN